MVLPMCLLVLLVSGGEFSDGSEGAAASPIDTIVDQAG